MWLNHVKMTPKYKLIYFNTYGRAEPLRYIFAYAGQDYVYEIIEKENWPKLKPSKFFKSVYKKYLLSFIENI